jgi:hypothetical protein
MWRIDCASSPSHLRDSLAACRQAVESITPTSHSRAGSQSSAGLTPRRWLPFGPTPAWPVRRADKRSFDDTQLKQHGSRCCSGPPTRVDACRRAGRPDLRESSVATGTWPKESRPLWGRDARCSS